jgi:uncharacterized protein YodC (DUF2158 family)
MANTFKIGHVVQLKSGGPKMTVTKVGDSGGVPTAWCAWFDASDAKQGSWPESALWTPRNSAGTKGKVS